MFALVFRQWYTVCSDTAIEAMVAIKLSFENVQNSRTQVAT